MDWDMTGTERPLGPGLPAWWFPQDPFRLDGDVDPIADHDTTALQGDVERRAKVAAVERPGRGEPGSLVAVRVGTEPVDLDPQLDLAGDPVRGQLTVEDDLFTIET